MLQNNITRVAGRLLLKAQKVSPTMMVVGGVMGVVVTATLASKATLKVGDIIEEIDDVKDKGRELLEKFVDGGLPDEITYTKKDYHKDLTIIYTQSGIKLVKLYTPTLIVGGVTIASILGSHRIMLSRGSGLLAAYKGVEKSFEEYRSRVKTLVGEEEELGIRHGLVYENRLVEDETDGSIVKQKILVDFKPSEYAVCFDEKSQSWSREHMYNETFLKCQQTYMNDKLRMKGHVFLNEVYDCLGLARTPAGAVVGWVLNNPRAIETSDNYVDFNIRSLKDRQIRNGGYWLDFNVDGIIYDLIGEK